MWDVADWLYSLFDQWGVFVRGMYLDGGVVRAFVQMSVFLFGVMLCVAVMFCLGGLLLVVFCFVVLLCHLVVLLFGCIFDVFV